MNLTQKKQILGASKPLINRYIFERTVVLAAHNETGIYQHGTGMLLKIEDQPLVITAAHVIRNIDPDSIQLITTEKPSNYRFAPQAGDLYGGDVNDNLDVGFLRLGDSTSPLLAGKQFLTLDDLEFFPTGLTTDLAILFGMPGTEHKEPIRNVHEFGSFTYFTNFPEDLDWSAPGNRPTLLSIDYDDVVEDAFTGQEMALPDPHGMSGGGVWRARYAGASVWTTANLRLVAILTEYHQDKSEVKANRVENLYHLLSHHFTLPPMTGDRG